MATRERKRPSYTPPGSSGHRPGHLSGREHDLHRPDRVRPVEHPVRRHVPSPGRHGDRRRRCSARGSPAASAPSASTWRAGGRPRVDGAARRRAPLHRQPRGSPTRAARRDGNPRRRIRPHRADPQHVHRRVPPDAVDRSVLVLNALLGLGPRWRRCSSPSSSASASGGAAAAVGDPARRAAGREPPAAAAGRSRAASRNSASGEPIPRRFWLFAGFAVLYGICETMNGNWSQLDMTTELGASTTGRQSPSRRSGRWSLWAGCSSRRSSGGSLRA